MPTFPFGGADDGRRPVNGAGAYREKKIRTLHLHEASLEKEDSIDRMQADIRYACNTGADVIGFTEVIGTERRQAFLDTVRNQDYMPVVPNGVGLNTPLAVKLGGEANTKIRSKGAKLALNGTAGKYENRYISWVQIKWHGQDIWVHVGHWSRTKHGTARHTDVTQMMAAQVKKHGQGDAISFWMGDLNVDTEGEDSRRAATNLNTIFREAGLLSLFDELHVNPPQTLTDKGVYDVIGSYRPDKQVEGKRYKIHPKQNSNHRQVSVWYDIDVARRPAVNLGNTGDGGGGGGGGGGGNKPDPDFYATGGNIDWSDYLNNDLYPLPYAFGDSDSHRHG